MSCRISETLPIHPDSSGEFVQITEASSPVFAYGWSPSDPPLAPGTLPMEVFYAAPGSTRGDAYRREIVTGASDATVYGYDQDAVVATAKALVPLP